MSRSLVHAAVLSNRVVARDTHVLRLSVDLGETAQPGQFAMIHPGSDDEFVLPRPFSILDHAGSHFDVLVKIVGRGSAQLAQLQPGDRCRVFAPLGRPFELGAFRGREAILVAGGVGLVPLHWLARRLQAAGQATVHSIFGARSPEDLPLELFADPSAGSWELWVEQSPEPGQEQGLVTEGLIRALERSSAAIVGTCGPTAMMHAVARICREREIPCWVCLEEQMGCGAGVCRSCVIEDHRGERMRTVCKEGPVFDLREILFLPEDRERIGLHPNLERSAP
jgi:dihydroorotate dehydrogenase electron transfer subunit